MKFNFGLYSSILLAFFLHIMVFAGVAFKLSWSQKLKSAFWLGLMLLLVDLYLAPFLLGYAGWYGFDGYRELLFYLPLQQLFLIGPVFLLYLKSLLNPSHSIKKKEWLHFLPGALYLMYTLFLFVYDFFLSDQIYFYRDGRDKDFDLWYQIAGYLSLNYYFLRCLVLYHNYKKAIFEHLSYAEEITYAWIRNFLLSFLFILFLRGLFFIINPEWGEFGRKFWYYLAIAIIGYYLALQGYRQSLLLNVSLINGLVRENLPIAMSWEDYDHEDKRLEKEDFSQDDAEWVKAIEQIMVAEQLYKNPVLTLSDLASTLNTTSKNISQAINKVQRLNFNDYINGYRVKAVIQAIEADAYKRHTLLGIAISCGFNSKSTFNRAFKKVTGISPNEYIQKTKSHLKSPPSQQG